MYLKKVFPFRELIKNNSLRTAFAFIFVIVLSLGCYAQSELLEVTAENFEVAEVFSDSMVFQQNEPIKVWGTSTHEGGVVGVRFDDSYGTAVVENGAWCVSLSPRVADTVPHTLEVYGITSAERRVFEDVLVGDVYLVIGQSNVGYRVGSLPEEQMPEANGLWEERVRLLTGSASDLPEFAVSTGKRSKKNEENIALTVRRANTWHRASHGECVNASALGYLFAKELCTLGGENIPIGVISIGFGGLELRSFVDPTLAKKLSGYGKASVVYENFIRPLLPFAVRGVVWYQGEANAPYYAEYADGLCCFIEQLRADKAQEKYTDFPFYIVELPPCFAAPEGYTGEDWQFIDFGLVRAASGSVPSRVENTYICVTSDLWNDRFFANNLHPNNKPGIAARLSRMAAKNAWGYAEFEGAYAPTVRTVEQVDEEGYVYDVYFDHTSGALYWKGDMAGLYGVDEEWNAPELSVEFVSEDCMRVTSSEILYRLCYASQADDVFGENATLCGGSGVPAAAFLVDLRTRPVTWKMRFNVLLLHVVGWTYRNRYILMVGFLACVIAVAVMVKKHRKKKQEQKKEQKA